MHTHVQKGSLKKRSHNCYVSIVANLLMSATLHTGHLPSEKSRCNVIAGWNPRLVPRKAAIIHMLRRCFLASDLWRLAKGFKSDRGTTFLFQQLARSRREEAVCNSIINEPRVTRITDEAESSGTRKIQLQPEPVRRSRNQSWLNRLSPTRVIPRPFNRPQFPMTSD